MHIDWSFVLAAIGLALVFEGLPYFVWAEKMPRILLHLATRPPQVLRMLGLASMLGGLLLIFISRS
ncbi:MAG: DUF2065 domain-containing protein [Desulfovibrio sp.]|uniref:DUF2065 domain-containing protein n=1 Tax=Desulfovibrio sp. 7SRBS1 TaxID=3378064 RepID=UPI003B3D5AAC